MRSRKRFRAALTVTVLVGITCLMVSWGGALAAISAGVDVTTYHNDNARTGQNLNETALTPATVSATSFGKVGLFVVDGKVDAQPLLLSSVAVPGQGTHNVLYVATEHGSVYGLDAVSGAILWQRSLLGTGESPSDSRGCSQVTPEIGVTSTPVIDRSRGPNGVIYVVAMTKSGSGAYFQRLHALDVTTGVELFGGPQNIQASFAGSAGLLTFDPKQYEERAGLLLVNGMLITAWTSHCDIDPYTGWIMAYNPTTLAQTSVLNVTPNGSRGAFWMAGAGPAADANGNIYLLDGNGTFDETLDANGFPSKGDFGNAFLKVSTSSGLKVSDYFATFNTVQQSVSDTDLGSGGTLVLPDLLDVNGRLRHLAIGAGKDKHIYVVDRDAMGKWNTATSDNSNAYQDIVGGLAGGVWSMPAYFNNTLYYGASGDTLKAFAIVNARVSSTAGSHSAKAFAYPGTTPGISASGSTNGIVWAVENANPAVLHAYDALDLSHELYNSSQAASSRDAFGPGNKFITPTIVNGRVYVGTATGVAVFGLLPGVASSVSVAPSAGAGSNQLFALQYTDTVGATDVATAWVWFNATLATTGANSCVAQYDRQSGTVSLLNDAASQWTAGSLGSAGTLQNSQCTISLANSSATANGTGLTWNLAVTFASRFTGAKNVYMLAATVAGLASDWQSRGTWQVPGTPVVTADASSPNAGSGASRTFALQYTDTVGATDVANSLVWFYSAATSSGVNSCIVYYDRRSNTVSLLNDAATQWIAAALGSAGTLQNSQCGVTLGSSTSATLSGNVLTWNVAMTFTSRFSGLKGIDIVAASVGGVSSGWQARGTWTVP